MYTESPLVTHIECNLCHNMLLRPELMLTVSRERHNHDLALLLVVIIMPSMSIHASDGATVNIGDFGCVSTHQDRKYNLLIQKHFALFLIKMSEMQLNEDDFLIDSINLS